MKRSNCSNGTDSALHPARWGFEICKQCLLNIVKKLFGKLMADLFERLPETVKRIRF